MSKKFDYFISCIPIFSDINKVRRKHFFSAFSEVAVTIFLSTFPLWAGAFAVALSDPSSSVDSIWSAIAVWWVNLVKAIDSGALIIYSASLISPVLYIALQDYNDGNGRRAFPSPIAHIMFTVIVLIVATVYFTRQISEQPMNPGFAFYASVYLFFSTAVVLYVVNCYKYMMAEINPVREFEATDKVYATDYSEYRRENRDE